MDRCLRISERKARLLGLDAPAAVKIESSNAVDDEIATLLAQPDERAREDERRRLDG